mmetsp:Transcript_8810/g.13152  ORF Transcript_8810/g.13152 Transcript_8810/m.13152 type:complete len:113 (-) Transcript_8810:219-557(-)
MRALRRLRWRAPVFCRSFCEAQAVNPYIEQVLKEVKCEEYAEKFQTVKEFLESPNVVMKHERGVDSPKDRKRIMRQVELTRQKLKLGLLKLEDIETKPKVETEETSAEGEES